VTADREDRPARRGRVRVRRERSVTETLCSIVLGLEAAVVFFAALLAFGLRVLEPAWAFGGGAVAMVLIIALAGRLRHRWAVDAGWVVQAGLVASGFLLPVMFVVGLGFAGFYAYCVVQGTRIDRRKAAWAAEAASPDPEGTP
jgi:hypothetical protein